MSFGRIMRSMRQPELEFEPIITQKELATIALWAGKAESLIGDLVPGTRADRLKLEELHSCIRTIRSVLP